MSNRRTLLMVPALALAGFVVPVEVNLSPVSGEGLIGFADGSAQGWNCAPSPEHFCSLGDGGWVEFYCAGSPDSEDWGHCADDEGN